MEFLQKSLTARLLTLFILLTMVPTAIIGYIAYRSGRQSIVDNVESHLESVAILKEHEIQNWVKHLEDDITWLATHPNTINNAYIKSTHTVDDPEYLKAHDLLVSDFKRMTNLEFFSHVHLLCSTSGKIIASSDTSWEGKIRKNEPYFTKGKVETYLSDIFYSLTLGRPTMVFSTPIEDSNGKLLGVMVAHANLEYLSEIMMERSGLGETGETFLVNSSNLLITNTVFAPDGAFKKWIFGQGAVWALEGKTGVGLFTDYRGVPVIGAYRWMGDLRLVLIAKQDRSEAFAPTVILGYTVFGISVIVVLAAVILSMFFARTITRPIHKLTEGIEMVVTGNLDYKVGTAAKDEIGVLSRSFDKMTKNLKEITVSRNELAKEVTERERVEKEHEKLLHDMLERYKEQRCMYGVAESISKRETLEEIFLDVATLIPPGWHYPKITRGKVRFDGREYVFDQFEETVWKQSSDIVVGGKKRGEVEVYLLEECPALDEGPFLKEERNLIEGITNALNEAIERKLVEGMLKEHMENLEEMVEERTKELKGAQEELVRKEKLAILGQLSGSVGHELRNPLGVISNAIYYLKTILPDANEITKEYLDIISSEVQNSEKIVSDLLDFSRIKSSEKEETVVSGLVDVVLTKLIPLDGVKVVTDIATDLPQIYVDRRQIGQVFDNLVTNAYQAMQEGGELKIEAKKVESKVHISFKDNGSGISKENIGKLFEPLFTTKAKGIGLGLSVSKNLVEANGGRIEVKSEKEKGSTFTVILPTKGGKS